MSQLAAGLEADIVAVAGDRLSDISAVARLGFVTQSGAVVRHDAG